MPCIERQGLPAGCSKRMATQATAEALQTRDLAMPILIERMGPVSVASIWEVAIKHRLAWCITTPTAARKTASMTPFDCHGAGRGAAGRINKPYC